MNTHTLIILILSILLSFYNLSIFCDNEDIDIFHNIEDFPLDENNRLIDHFFIYLESPNCIESFSDEK